MWGQGLWAEDRRKRGMSLDPTSISRPKTAGWLLGKGQRLTRTVSTEDNDGEVVVVTGRRGLVLAIFGLPVYFQIDHLPFKPIVDQYSQLVMPGANREPFSFANWHGSSAGARWRPYPVRQNAKERGKKGLAGPGPRACMSRGAGLGLYMEGPT
ncbi:uncharacterized protein J3R85_013293 [Psidium guajava]|nr:uncharacterized protein J3R85_013293 [Psidium guajava]